MNNDGFAAAQDAAQYFGYKAPTEEEFRRIRADQDGEVAQATDSSAPAAPAAPAFVVLARGRDEVLLPEKVYAEMLAENFLPPANGGHMPLVAKWLAQSAEKRGLASLAKALMHLHGDGNGRFTVRLPVATIEVAQSSGEGHQATAAGTDLSDEVASYLDAAAAEADDAPPVHAGWTVGRRRLRPLVRVDGLAALEGT